MSDVTKYWAAGFSHYHPDVHFEIRLMGSDTAIPGLYAGLADIALLGREDNITDDNGFGRVKNYPPLRLQLMGGSLDVPGKTAALVVYVHRDNPVSQLTLAQLAALFGCDSNPGRVQIRTWGELGATGEWASHSIDLYSYDVETDTGVYFQRMVLGGSHKLAWEGLTEFRDRDRNDGSIYRAGEQSVDALRRDPYGLALSSLAFANGDVKALALASAAGGAYYTPTRETVIAGDYPLARRTFAFVDRSPGAEMAPRIQEFLRYTLSREGQADVARDGGYLPLSDGVRAAQEALLE